jgi:hypothetical protein
MERKSEVDSALGKENVEMLMHELREGFIKDYEVKSIALAMKNGVHGVHEHKKNTENLEVIMKHMLDCWWSKVLCRKDIDGVQQLTQILQNNGQEALAEQVSK